MTASNAIVYIRQRLAEQNSNQRWGDSTLLGFLDRAQKIIVQDIKFPTSRFVFSTIASVQEYQLEEVLRINEVYIEGQPIVRTTKPVLQGQQIQFDDQTGSGGGPSGIIPNGGVSPIIVGQYTPQWTGLPAATYPVASSLGYPSPSTSPGYPGMRPEYYLNGGNIGFVPAPSGVYPVVIDCIRQPSSVTSLTSTMVLPDIALEALAWYVAEQCYFSDRAEAGSQMALEFSSKKADDALRNLRTWARQYTGYGPRGPKPLTYRSFGRSSIRRNGCR